MEIIGLLRDIGILGLAMWFIQHLLTKSADKKFESYKTELDQKTREFQTLLGSKLELYKYKLNLQNYKATQVYEKQLNIFIELHKRLRTMNKDYDGVSYFSNEICHRKDDVTKQILLMIISRNFIWKIICLFLQKLPKYWTKY
jgi:hypothetical protein